MIWHTHEGQEIKCTTNKNDFTVIETVGCGIAFV